MRIVFAVCTAFFLSTAPSLPAAADDPPKDGLAKNELSTEAGPQMRAQHLDKLFTDLKRERNEKSAERIANRVWAQWNQSGSASIDLMMQWSQKAIGEQKFDVALDFLDQVVTLQPTYAEGWNRRATVHFMMKNYQKAMADIEQTLELEPRHFGAISGMAQIFSDTGRKEQALRAWQRALDVYPMMRNAQNQVAILSEELAGEGI
ncbi:tetratricopeptide repeat protein [Mesorhizobium sp. BE184]|uniref:tetratricopeptide repeat protein n=1 Tax=Mesorhizobium sp. BE184 TaxID=2817714 RepID=UPI00285A701F|nr:tetratricopeptide repeat protein [Mesorhizobium sp. BE184]MDR7034184.1 tetratricopeptide (TPR) repeat protein [Mesorhizobium sp. BE184]